MILARNQVIGMREYVAKAGTDTDEVFETWSLNKLNVLWDFFRRKLWTRFMTLQSFL